MNMKDKGEFIFLNVMYEEAKWAVLRGIGKLLVICLAWWVFV